VAAVDLSDLRLIEPDQYVYRLEHNKTQQAGPSATSTPDKPILGCRSGDDGVAYC